MFLMSVLIDWYMLVCANGDSVEKLIYMNGDSVEKLIYMSGDLVGKIKKAFVETMFFKEYNRRYIK